MAKRKRNLKTAVQSKTPAGVFDYYLACWPPGEHFFFAVPHKMRVKVWNETGHDSCSRIKPENVERLRRIYPFAPAENLPVELLEKLGLEELTSASTD